jgi:hypothetical protein
MPLKICPLCGKSYLRPTRTKEKFRKTVIREYRCDNDGIVSLVVEKDEYVKGSLIDKEKS